MALALSLTFGLVFSDLSPDGGLGSADNQITDSVEGGGTDRPASSYAGGAVIKDTASGLNTYEAGTTYWYTDYATGVKLSDGDTSVKTDRIVVTVDTASAKGTQKNPYVINSIADWQAFVTYVAKSGVNYGAGKYFVLNADLDYNGATLPVVVQFAGTFYGNGHTISNAVYQDRYNVDEQTVALFTLLTGSPYISDLSVVNYHMGSLTKSTGNVMGAIAGVALVTNVTIANCKTQGVMEMNTTKAPTDEKGSTPVGNWSFVAGGILGCWEGNENANLYFYKNSVDVKGIIRTSRVGWPMLGGLIGTIDAWNYKYRMANANFYDCYASVDYDLSSEEPVSNAFSGFVGFTRNMNRSTYRNCVYIANYNVNSLYEPYSARPEIPPKHYISLGLLTTIGEKRGTDTIGYTIDCKNFFGYGIATRENKKYGIPFMGEYQSSGFTGVTNSFVNCNVYSGAVDVPATSNSTIPKPNSTCANLDAWKNAAKSVLTNKQTWNSSTLDGIKEPAAGSNTITKPDITENPIVVSKTRITFAEQDGSLMNLTGGANPVEFSPEDIDVTALPTPATIPAGKIFAGWSVSKTSDANVLKNFPANLYGNVTMYPVWDMDGATVTVNATAAEFTDGAVNADNRTATAKYIDGKTAITLSAQTGMPVGAGISAEDCNITWNWYKDGTLIEGATASTLELSQRAQSGRYEARAVIRHKTQLWRTVSAVASQEWTVTVNQGTLTQGGITLADKDENGKDIFAYWGQPLSELTNYVVTTMTNTAGDPISGSIKWTDTTTSTVGQVQGNYKAKFIPAESYNGDYPETDITVTISPTILQLKFEFQIEGQDKEEFVYNIEYGTKFTGAMLATKFEQSYFSLLDGYLASNKPTHDAMVGQMPYFPTNIQTTDKGYVKIGEFRGTQHGNTEFAKFDSEGVALENYIVKTKEGNKTSAILTMPLKFESDPQAFEVKLFNNIENNVKKTTEKKLGYGALIENEVDSIFIDNGVTQYLAGWFKCDNAGENLTEDMWSFSANRVSGNTYITADWRNGSVTLQSITAKKRVNQFTARSVPKSSDYIVTGVYEVTNPEEGTSLGTIELVLSPDDYTVVGEGANGVYHVHKDTTGYAYGMNDRVVITAKSASSITTKVDVKVVAKEIDLSGINFPPVSVVADGTAKIYPKVSNWEFLDEQGVAQTDYFIGGEAQVTYEYRNAGDQIVTSVVDVGTYYVKLTINWTTDDLTSNSVSTTFTLTEQPKSVLVEWDCEDGFEFTYNGQPQQPKAKFYLETDDPERPNYITILCEYSGNGVNAVNASSASYTVNVQVQSSRYELSANAVKSITFKINRAQVEKPSLANTSFEYQPDGYDLTASLGYTADQLNILNITGANGSDVKNYTLRVELVNKLNSEWVGGGSDAVEIKWEITKKSVRFPAFTETLTYNGQDYNLSEHVEYFDDTIMEFSLQTVASAADSYKARVTFKDSAKQNYMWESGAPADGMLNWNIQKADIYLNWNEWKFVYNDSALNPYAPRVQGLIGLAANDENHYDAMKIQECLSYSGQTQMREAGSYKIEVSIKPDSDLDKNYQLAATEKVFYWVIKANSQEVILTVEWDLPNDGRYTYNGNIQSPKVRALYGESGMAEDLGEYEISYEGDSQSKWAGTYKVTAVITSIDGTQLRLRGGEINYRIRTNNGEGNNPDTDPNIPVNPNPDGEGNNPSGGTIGAIPQLIISGVSLVLILVFLIMTFNYASTAKEAKAKTKKLAQISYSFSPVGLLALGLFGLTEMNWWIIAGALMGVALLMAIIMFTFRKKSKKALAMLEEEQMRIEEEKEAAKEAQQEARDAQMREEQQRRDNELRMMFAAMQQNYQQPQVGYDDMQNMIASAVTALLPGLQQSLQALPPAQSESMAQPSYAAPETPDYNQAGNNADEYAEMKRIIEEQQEMLNQYRAQGDEQFTLEELYGKLDDGARRLYYELGGYIMSKPETSQNDGKYAVLFKYRGKTLFKLCIRNNAPVLIYGLDTATQTEMAIDDENTLTLAKQIIDLQMSRVDKGM